VGAGEALSGFTAALGARCAELSAEWAPKLHDLVFCVLKALSFQSPGKRAAPDPRWTGV